MQHNRIPDRLKELRRKLGLSQTEFGRKIGKNYHTVMRWEMGKVTPPSNVLSHIAELHNVSLNWLENGCGEMLPCANRTAENQPLIPLLSGADPEPETYITVPGINAHCEAIKARADSAPPVICGDTVIYEPCTAPSGSGLYIINDSYGDTVIRWYGAKSGKWLSKRPDYPDLDISSAEIKGKVVKILREISI